MVKYCKECGLVITDPIGRPVKGHSGLKAVAGGLLFGPAGAIAGASHGISNEINSPDLCRICRLRKVHKYQMKVEDDRLERERKLLEMRFNPIESKLEDDSQEDPLKILKTRYAKGEITKEEFEQMKKDIS